MLTEKDYCDYDTCVALKKLGYNEKTLAYYTSEGFFHWVRAYIYDVAIPDLANSSNKKPYKHIIDAMSLYEAQKWLREEKHLHIEVRWFSNLFYEYEVKEAEGKVIAEGCAFPTYEEALSTAVRMAVECLKENEDGRM